MTSRITLPESAKPRSELAIFLTFLRHRIDPDVRVLGPFVRRTQRLGKRVTQEELAEAIGVSREWYATLESGATTRTSTRLAHRMADALIVAPEERARLFHLALPEVWRMRPREDSTAVLEAFSRLRSLAKPLWAATSIEDVLTTTSEQIAEWFNGALLVGSSRRSETGVWEHRSVDDREDRNHAAKALRELAGHVLRTTGSKDDFHLYPRMGHAGDIATPDLLSLALQRDVREVYTRHRVGGFAWVCARVRSRSGFSGGLYVLHELGHSYSASDRAVLGAFAELTSFALS
jgi:transcriptional regulator with XRE-family HTH domain